MALSWLREALLSHFPHYLTLLRAAMVGNWHTLDSRLRAKGRQRSHAANHEVLEDLGTGLAALTPVRSKGRDLGGVGGTLEGAVE